MNARRRARGLTLIEVLVALSILSLSLLALIPMFSLGVKTNASANELGVANTLAREKLEQLTCYPSIDPRLAVPVGQDTGTFATNDLPLWYKPGTGQTSPPATMSGAGWYPYPYSRSYTVRTYTAADATHIAPIVNSSVPDESVYNVDLNVPGSPQPYYNVKLVTVTVLPRTGPLPGLRKTVQSAYVRFRNAISN